MRLRTLLMTGLGIMVSLLVAAGLLIVHTQTSFYLSQLDVRLGTLKLAAAQAIKRGAVQPAPSATEVGKPKLAAALSDVYVGWIPRAGQLRAITEPLDEQGVTPVLKPGISYPNPTTVPTLGGNGDPIRVVTFPLRDGGLGVAGMSLAEVQEARADLIGNLLAIFGFALAITGAVFFWMLRLGLAPIIRVTQTARAISAGDTSARVETFPAGTEAADLGRAFNLLVDSNQQNQDRLRQFVADASHELRTPLMALTGYTSLYSAGAFSDRDSLDDAMHRMHSESVRMTGLVADLLLLAELDHEPCLELGRVDLVPIVTGLAADMRALDPDRAITVHAPARAIVSGDQDRLTQAIAVLTSNAIRHTPAGTPIELQVEQGLDVVVLEVTDHGAGIPAADIPHIFDRFYRSDAARTRRRGGAGLGLAIASALVDAHGGRLGVDSAGGRGATFWVELPSLSPHDR